MSDPAQVSPQRSPIAISLRKNLRGVPASAQRTLIALLICGVISQVAMADSVTYQQLRLGQEGRARVTSSAPAVVDSRTQSQQDKQSQAQSGQTEQSQAGVAQESPEHPEFVRLPDGRIVRYGPGILCDENCVE